jgi:PhzF family phenazine biosynthesis protein
MKLVMYQVDAFTDRVFGGNPAAVCPLDAWLPDHTLQAIAAENSLAATAFFVKDAPGYRLRWFTPAAEVDLCGHATLATAEVLFRVLGCRDEAIRFETRSGTLEVSCRDGLHSMDFPATVPVECAVPPALCDALGATPHRALKAFDHIAIFDTEEHVRALTPDLGRLSTLDLRGVVVSAPGQRADFVSRFFAPKLGINEDPVTGSAHCELTPYWSARLGKTMLHAEQISQRGGTVLCELRGDRVILRGRAALYMTAEIEIEAERQPSWSPSHAV